jgi:signal transduction histidine kinase/CheY-like chemotaxis protein
MTGFFKLKIINVIFLVAVCLLIFSSYLVFQQIERLLMANDWVIQSHQIIEKTNNALLDVLDGERLEHDYFNTNNPALLPGSEADFADIQTQLNNLRNLMVNHPDQKQAFEALASKLQQRKTLYEAAKIAYEKTHAGQPEVIIKETQEQVLTNQIKQIVDSINQKEYMFLNERNKKAVLHAHQTFLTVVMFGKFGGIMLLLSFLMLNFQEKKNAELQLRINQDLIEQNKRANEATRLKSEFLANMSHELRTPLNAIIGFSELMQDKEVGPITQEQSEFLNDILVSARHLLQLINDVLDLSKVEAGKMDFHPEEVNLPKLVKEVILLVHPLSKHKRITITTNIDDEVSNVFIDPSRFKQVLYNYLSNAIKFTPELGKVKISILQDDGHGFRLEVKDNGIGMHPGDLKRLFAEFQQLDASSGKKYAGTGLGLALTKQIIEAQRGSVGVVSTLGQGSTFYAILPRMVPTKEMANFPTSSLMAKPKKFALIIQSNPAELAWLTKNLTTHAYEYTTVESGEDALKNCEKKIYDLIALDLQLPDVDGYELLKKIRLTRNKNAPVVILVATESAKDSHMILLSNHMVLPIEKENFFPMIDRTHTTS